MIKQPITDGIKSEAMKHAKDVTEINGEVGHKFGNNSVNQHYIGQIGELIFRTWLKNHNIHGTHHRYNEDGSSDEYDFKLNGSDKSIDVKTYQIKYNTNYMLSRNLMYIEESQITKVMDYYVDCVLDEWQTYAYLRGYILRSDALHNYKVVNSDNMTTPGYEIPTSNLGDIRELIFKITGKLIDGYVKPPKQYTMEDMMKVDLSAIPIKPKGQYSMADY